MADWKEAFDLSGRVAVVTGAGSGIGRGSAEMLASAGATVVCADVNGDGAKATATSIADAGGQAEAAVVDVTSRDDVFGLVEGAAARHGRLDVMCNIAGIMQESSVIDTTEADLDRVLGVNLKGVFFGCQAAARIMVDAGGGSIVNMASSAIDTAAPNIVCYAMAKSAVTKLTQTLAMEVGAQGVRVNAIAPGLIVTGMTARHWTGADGTVDEAAKEAVISRFARMSILNKVGAPEDIAWAVLYLASDAARYVTGQIMRPNGGASMPW